MRLFIALDLDERVKEYLGYLQRVIHLPGDKLSLSSGFHITLKFLGEVSEERLEALRGSLRGIDFNELKLKTSGVGVFRRKGKVSVVWAGIEPKKEVEDLYRKIEDTLVEEGFDRDRRFHPHVTIARVKYLSDKKRFVYNLKKIEKKEIHMSVKSFAIFRSHLTSQGPIYSVVEKFWASK